MSNTEEKRYCYKYPHPAVTTDCVIFGFDGKQLHILLVERGLEPFKGMWALPGGFVNINETVEEGAARELREETGINHIYMEQFHVFSQPDRDPRERVITVAFVALVRKSDYRVIGGDDASDAQWFFIDELPPLAFDHQEIIDKAREHLKNRLKVTPIAFKLLDKVFSMAELQHAYEAISGQTYDRRNFYRKALQSGYIDDVDKDIMSEDYHKVSFFDRAERHSFCFEAPSLREINEAAEPVAEKKTGRGQAKLFSFNKMAFKKQTDDGDKRNPFSF